MKQLFAAILLFSIGVCRAQDTSSTVRPDSLYTAVVIPVSGNVDPGMAAYVARAVETALTYPNPLIIFKMDTFGGRVDAAFEIVDTLLNIPDSVPTISFVEAKAISAGALIALAGKRLAMRQNTTIGDCAPIAVSSEGPQMLGEKFQSPLRAKFRALARRGGYPSSLAESMVTAEMVVYRVTFPDTVLYLDSLTYEDLSQSRKNRIKSRETVVSNGELLTMNAEEARELGFSSATVSTIEQMLEVFEMRTTEIVTLEPSWSERFVRLIGGIAPILMMIGFAALYAEIKSPGFGLPGIIGIICLGLVFGGQYIVGLANYTELLLIVLGIVLLTLELFVIPGFGIAGIMGIAAMAAGMVLSFQDFVIPDPEFPWEAELLQRNILMVLVSLAGSLLLLVLFFRYLFPRLSTIVAGPYLAASLQGARSTDDDQSAVHVGDKGIVTKTLRPSGNAKFSGRFLDVITDGEYIPAGTNIVIVQITGSRIVVQQDSSNDK